MQNQLQAERFDFLFLLVDFLVGGDHLLRQTKVVSKQRADGVGNGGLAERAHRNQAVVEQHELLVKAVAHNPFLPFIRTGR